MAIINSVTIGAGQRSIGNVTLQHYRGRTIAKKKITANPARIASSLQLQQRDLFKYGSNVCQQVRMLAKQGYNKTKYGSEYNAFMKQIMPTIADVNPAHYANAEENPIEYWKPGRQYIFGGINFMAALSQYAANSEPFYIAHGISLPLVYNWTVSNAIAENDKVTVMVNIPIPDQGYKTVHVFLMALESSANTMMDVWTTVPKVIYSQEQAYELVNGLWVPKATNPLVNVGTEGVSMAIAFVKIDGVPVDIEAEPLASKITKPDPATVHTAGIVGKFERTI